MGENLKPFMSPTDNLTETRARKKPEIKKSPSLTKPEIARTRDSKPEPDMSSPMTSFFFLSLPSPMTSLVNASTIPAKVFHNSVRRKIQFQDFNYLGLLFLPLFSGFSYTRYSDLSGAGMN